MTRFSRQREAVKDAVKNTVLHPSAETVYETVKRTVPDISMGTVYRNLKSLTESGEITTVETTSAELRYDGNTGSHAHFVCLECGKIFDADEETGGHTRLNELGFVISRQKTVMYGYCPECKNRC